MTGWFVYILGCADDSLYTGITRDIDRRICEHNGESSRPGARYTRSRRPVELLYSETWPNRTEASKREAAIKALTRAQKLQLIQQQSSEHENTSH